MSTVKVIGIGTSIVISQRIIPQYSDSDKHWYNTTSTTRPVKKTSDKARAVNSKNSKSWVGKRQIRGRAARSRQVCKRPTAWKSPVLCRRPYLFCKVSYIQVLQRHLRGSIKVIADQIFENPLTGRTIRHNNCNTLLTDLTGMLTPWTKKKLSYMGRMQLVDWAFGLLK